jgi:hypothetical protein
LIIVPTIYYVIERWIERRAGTQDEQIAAVPETR